MNKPRLIDANALLEELDASDRDIYCKHLIEDAPTAYDIDKVVEQLEEIKTKYTSQAEECTNRKPANGVRCNYNLAVVVGIEKAIEIVKGGAK